MLRIRHIILFTLYMLLLLSCTYSPTTKNKERVNAADSIKIFALFEAAQAIQGTSTDSAYNLLQQAGRLAKKNDFGNGIMNYYNYAVFNQCAFKGNYSLGKKLADSAMQYAIQPGNETYKMSACFTNAIYHQSKEEQDAAIRFYLDALKYQGLTTDSSKLEATYNNLAILFNYQGRYAQAIEYQKKSLGFYLEAKDTAAVIGYYNNMYRHYLGAKDTVNAEMSIRNALQLSQLQKRWVSENEIFKCAGDFYLMKGRADSAIFFYTQHLNYTAKIYDSSYLAQPYVSLASAYIAQKNTEKAKYYLQLATQTAMPGSLPLLSRKEYYEVAYQLALQYKNNAQALAALEKLNAINETFLEKQRSNELSNYDRQIKELENEKLKLAGQLNLKQKNLWITILAMSCLTLVSIGFMGVLYLRKRKTAAAAQLAKLQLENEWKQLKNRMDTQAEERNRISKELHDDLGATLTSISLAASILQENQHNREVDIIARASSDMAMHMNEIVWSLNADNDNLQSLAAYIRKFCNAFLKEAGIEVVFSEDILNPQEEIKGFIRRNVYHTIKEAVNNIVKHAAASTVHIHVKTDTTYFYITILDNGKGMHKKETNTWNNGLRNMQKNIEHIKGTINWLFKEGTEVSIQTPLKL